MRARVNKAAGADPRSPEQRHTREEWLATTMAHDEPCVELLPAANRKRMCVDVAVPQPHRPPWPAHNALAHANVLHAPMVKHWMCPVLPGVVFLVAPPPCVVVRVV